MKFADYDKDDREGWRHAPITRAAFERLREQLEAARREVYSAAMGQPESEVRVAAGTVRGLEVALTLLSEE